MPAQTIDELVPILEELEGKLPSKLHALITAMLIRQAEQTGDCQVSNRDVRRYVLDVFSGAVDAQEYLKGSRFRLNGREISASQLVREKRETFELLIAYTDKKSLERVLIDLGASHTKATPFGRMTHDVFIAAQKIVNNLLDRNAPPYLQTRCNDGKPNNTAGPAPIIYYHLKTR